MQAGDEDQEVWESSESVRGLIFCGVLVCIRGSVDFWGSA